MQHDHDVKTGSEREARDDGACLPFQAIPQDRPFHSSTDS